MRRRALTAVGIVLVLAAFTFVKDIRQMGRQPDGRFLVSSGQTINPGTFSFKGRPADLALRPQGDIVAVMVKDQKNRFDRIFLMDQNGEVKDCSVFMRHEPGFHGMAWSPNGERLFVSTAGTGDSTPQGETHEGVIETFDYQGGKFTEGAQFNLNEAGEPGNVVPGGMCITKDGSKLYIPAGDLNAVLELDAQTGKRLRKMPCGMIPFAARLSADEKTLVVSNWGGRVPREGDYASKTGISKVVVDERGTPSNGTVTLIDLTSGAKQDAEVGIHPTDVLVAGDRAYIANAMSDSVSEIDLSARKVARTIRLSWNGFNVLGSMPVALALRGTTLYVCNGGDNALAEVDLSEGKVKGYHPAGYYPVSIALKGDQAWVLNSKGNGSVSRLAHGETPGNAHDFEGTISVIDLKADLKKDTETVAEYNGWGAPADVKPDLAVYHGAIKHVLYIIKENRTYDQVFGDMPEGNGDAKLADLGKTIMPNHQAIAREFTLFDNGYVSGTNSCDGHAWSTQSVANDYIEHFYVGYSRTYNDDGNCAMSLASSGCIWDAALAKKLSVRDYGEFCYADIAKYAPYRPKDWFEAWEDREKGTHKFTYEPVTLVRSLQPIVNKNIHYWPLIQSDQSRADEFIKEYDERSRKNSVPNLMVLSLPCDHSEGMDPAYPQPKSMMADNDLALGRVVEAVSRSPQWKDTCIFVIEDDAQSGPDHVDGHRTVYMVVSPYNKRHTVDHAMYTTVNMLKSIEMMLGLKPMNRFDTLAKPIDTCFQDKPDLTPYYVHPNRIALDLPNPGRRVATMSKEDAYWTKLSLSLDWSHPDGPNPYWLNRVIWYSMHKGTPYPTSFDTVAEKTDADDEGR
jgi:DNA-binding beta-propeller fold protein YncE